MITRRTLACASLFALVGCGPELDRPGEVKTLRVLAVQKSSAYAKPGETVELSMLWHDGSPKAPRPVSVVWLSGCFNPPADLYAGCGAVFAESAAGGGSGQFGLPPGVELGFGDQFEFTMPADVISSRPPPADPAVPPYGVAYVFFAACAGALGPAAPGAAFPLSCKDAAGRALGSDDFVAGYSATYAHDDFRNANPIITGFSFNGVSVEPSCTDVECLSVAPAERDCSAGEPCVEACSKDGDEDCPGFEIRPVIARESAEVDEIAKTAYGRDISEQVWVRYYTSGGSVDSDARLVNDAQAGWNEQYETKYRAPSRRGPVSIWAVVHDNRGGVAWTRLDIQIR